MEITERTSLRDILTTYPQTRPVMEQYGLLECGGAGGPDEPLGWFARVHRVAPERLLAELHAVITRGAAADVTPAAHADAASAAHADGLYRRFLLTAVGFLLTGGVLWGAINLSLIGYHQAFLDWLTVGNQAHAHVQIFGWVALFIMGVAYHVLPRLKATPLRQVGLGYASYWLMAGGVLLHAVYRPFMAVPALAPIPVLAGWLELAGILAFAVVIVETMRHGTTSADPSDKYLVAGTVGFVLMGIMNVALVSVMATQGTGVLPGAWNWAYRHLQLNAFIAMFILGVSLRTLPVFLGKPEINPRLDRVVFPLIVGGIVLRAAFDLLVSTGWLAPVALLLPAAMEIVGFLGFIWNLGIFKRTVNPVEGMDASARAYEKFVYAAYGWFLLSVSSIAVFTVYQAVTGTPVPHALMGSYRHALTVGFITFMILGYSMRVVPVFLGRPVYSVRLLNATFVLMMFGNTVRVLFQALTVPFGAWPFAVAGISGWFELIGLALFGYNLLRTLNATEAPSTCYTPEALEEETPDITPSLTVARLVEAYPQTADVLVAMGFAPIANPMLRATIGRRITLEQAAQIQHVPLDEMLDRLRAAV